MMRGAHALVVAFAVMASYSPAFAQSGSAPNTPERLDECRAMATRAGLQDAARSKFMGECSSATVVPELPAAPTKLPALTIMVGAAANTPLDRILQAIAGVWSGEVTASNAGSASSSDDDDAAAIETAPPDGSRLMLQIFGDVSDQASRYVTRLRGLAPVGLVATRRGVAWDIGVGLFAPPRTPPAVLAALRAEAERVLQTRIVRNVLDKEKYSYSTGRTLEAFLEACDQSKLMVVVKRHGVHDKISRALAVELKTTLVSTSLTENGADASNKTIDDEQTRLAREIKVHRTDGRRLLLAEIRADASADLVNALNELVPVADLGEHVDENGKAIAHRVYAPAGTPANVVSSLRIQISAAMAAPAYATLAMALGMKMPTR